MADTCYLCRRTQVDLDRLNEEIRTRVYLSYFSNARAQIDEQRSRISFLQRLKDEESGDPHFRINARQVFADPPAYQKMMPWIETLIDLAKSGPPAESTTIGMLVDQLLASEHEAILRMEEGLTKLRTGFPSGDRLPFALTRVTPSYPVHWSVDSHQFPWRPDRADAREPLLRTEGSDDASVEVELHLCTVCRKILEPH